MNICSSIDRKSNIPHYNIVPEERIKDETMNIPSLSQSPTTHLESTPEPRSFNNNNNTFDLTLNHTSISPSNRPIINPITNHTLTPPYNPTTNPVPIPTLSPLTCPATLSYPAFSHPKECFPKLYSFLILFY